MAQRLPRSIKIQGLRKAVPHLCSTAWWSMGYYAGEKDKYYLGLRLYELGNKAAEQYDIKKSRYRFLKRFAITPA